MGGISDIIPKSNEMAPTSKRRRKKSLVWEHFTIEAMVGGSTRACCKLCKQTFAYSSGSKIAGTSHLKRHIALGSCPKLKLQQLTVSASQTDVGDATCPPKRRYRRTQWANVLFDQDTSSFNLAKMIILHEYPIQMVEHPGFISFVQSLQPRFKMASVSNIEGEVFAVYHKEKQNLMQVFDSMPGKISLIVGLWTTSQTLGYLCLTGQFIDSEWKVQRRMLSFMLVASPHSENALSEAIGFSLSDWNMKTKLFTITLDNNCSSHDIYSANLRNHLMNKNKLVLRGQLFVVRCYAHILNVLAHDVIASIHGIIYNIRESIKFVKASQACEEKFAEIALQLQISCSKSVSLDVASQWNTTYLMLVAAQHYKQVFTCLEACEDSYNEAPSTDDWKRVEIACSFLKLLYDSANAIMSAADPTANIFFQEAYKIQLELTNSVSNDDSMVSEITKEMHEKFDKYWKDCSIVLAIAVLMDPRFKLKLVEFSFSKLYGEDAAKYVKVVDDLIHELYLEYEEKLESIIDNCSSESIQADGFMDFDMYISDMGVIQNMKSELDQYLEESLLPRMQEFDVLGWWRLNSIRYPTLSKMARDVLAIPMTMISSGSSIFDAGTGNNLLGEYYSSLSPEIVEALFCAKDWLQFSPSVAAEPPSNTIVKMEI